MLRSPRTGPARRALACAGLLALAGCRLEIPLDDFDAGLRAEGVRSVLFADGLSLYSPYDAVASRSYLEKLGAERAACFALFGVESAEPVRVWLRVDPGLGADFSVLEGDRLQLNGFSTRTDAGNTGFAGELEMVLLVDAPQALTLSDGRTLTGAFSPDQFTRPMRHELAHVASLLLGLPAESWLLEGVAHAVEFAPTLGERLSFEPRPEELLWAARLPAEARSIEALLAWQAGVPPAPGEQTPRLLAFSLVVFLLEREPDATTREGLLRISAAEPRDLCALQPAWSEWLSELARAR